MTQQCVNQHQQKQIDVSMDHKTLSRPKSDRIQTNQSGLELRAGLTWMFLLLGTTLAFGTGMWGCSNSSTGEDLLIANGDLSKADITVGPIQSISCKPQSHFVRRGGFGSFDVQALDAQGKASRNYELRLTPQTGTRVVQRNQVIFDQEGRYEVKCCSLDTEYFEQVAIHVGSLNPALSVDVTPFSEGEVQIKGQAMSSREQPAQVWVNGQEVPTNPQGYFEKWMPALLGVNRFEVKAMDQEGQMSIRHGWSIGGPFNLSEASSVGPLLQLGLSADAFKDLESLIEKFLIRSIRNYAQSDEFQKTQSGSELGYSFEITPTSIPNPQIDLSLTTGPRDGELQLHILLPQFTLLGEARTRFAQGAWRDRSVSVQADIEVFGSFILQGNELTLDHLDANVDQLDLEISDLPGFIEGILGFFFKRQVQNEILNALERAGNESLEGIISGFEIQETLELPEPLQGELGLLAQVAQLNLNAQGLQIGFQLDFNGETDPLYKDAPGSISYSNPLKASSFEHPYQAQFHLDLLNRLLFEVWQMGTLNQQTLIHDLIEGDEDEIQADRFTLFVSPQLPPVLTLGENQGELVFQMGGIRLDGILESNVGFWNCAVEAGVRAKVLINQWQDEIGFQVNVDQMDVDVLIAPGGWEVELTRQLLERIITKDVLPKYANMIRMIPLPQADLQDLNLDGIQSLNVLIDLIRSESNGLSFEGILDFSNLAPTSNP